PSGAPVRFAAADDAAGEDLLSVLDEDSAGHVDELGDARVGDPVVGVLAPSLRRDEAAPAQTHQVRADPSLDAADAPDELTDVLLAVGKQDLQNAQPGWIAQPPEELGQKLRPGIEGTARRREPCCRGFSGIGHWAGVLLQPIGALIS